MIGDGGLNTEDEGNVWPTADIHPGAPGVSLPHCLFPHKDLCRSPQTFAAPAVMPPCQTPMGRKQEHRKESYSSRLKLPTFYLLATYRYSMQATTCMIISSYSLELHSSVKLFMS